MFILVLLFTIFLRSADRWRVKAKTPITSICSCTAWRTISCANYAYKSKVYSKFTTTSYTTQVYKNRKPTTIVILAVQVVVRFVKGSVHPAKNYGQVLLKA